MSHEDLNIINQLYNSLGVVQPACNVEQISEHEVNNDYSLKTCDITTDYDIQLYLHSDPDKLFVNFA